MNNRAVTLSILLALFAVFMVESYVSSIEDAAKAKYGTTVFVVSAKNDIKELETINETMLELKAVPKEFLEPAAISFTNDDGQSVQEMQDLAGTIALVPIKEGEQITYNKLTEPNIRTGLSPQVTPGRRAVSIPVNETTGVAKLVKPGDRVDVIAILDVGGSKDNRLVKTILQDVVVLAVGRNVTNNVPRVIERAPGSQRLTTRSLTEYDGFASVTLEVDPRQAAAISLILATGSQANALNLALRNNDDTERVDVPSMTLVDVIGNDVRKVELPSPQGRFRQR